MEGALMAPRRGPLRPACGGGGCGDRRPFTLRLPGGLLKHLSYSPIAQDALGVAAAYVVGHYGCAGGAFWLSPRHGGAHAPSCAAAVESVHVRLRLLGGKGGFGSQLRAQGNRMGSKKRAGGYEACRDLSGRRIRSINQARIIADYLRRKPDLDRERENEFNERMRRAIEAPDRKAIFTDVDYLRTARLAVDTAEAAVYEALLEQASLASEDDDDPDRDPECDPDHDSDGDSDCSQEQVKEEEDLDDDRGKEPLYL